MSEPYPFRPKPPFHPTAHSKNRRARWHNYSASGSYMITLVVAGRKPLLGSLQMDPEPLISLSPLGQAIMDGELSKIHAVYPMVEVLRACIMPDHIHLVVNVVDRLPEGRHLGTVVGAFKGGCTRTWRRICPGVAEGQSLFEDGYNDRILIEGDQMLRWFDYLLDNPRRLAIKRQHPQLFTALYDYEVGGTKCQIFGNRFLLDIPDMQAVIVHRADSDAEYQAKFSQWMACGERGGVLVGTGIAPREKVVMREAMNRGYCLIVLREQGFPKIYKPSGEAFDACAEGRLLQVCPWEYHYDTRKITRSQCLDLNALALAITGGR